MRVIWEKWSADQQDHNFNMGSGRNERKGDDGTAFGPTISK